MQNPPTTPGQSQLGTPVPGTTGGLPALGGLSVMQNPMAQQLRSMGRGEDSMLVHMTPDEVNSLQGLAMAAGGSLSINPQTGLPEAGWLGKLLPTILGVAGAAFGLPTWAIGLGVGAGKTALTGDLSKGLMAGLEAFGGAGLGQAAGLGGAISNNALGLMGGQAASSGAATAAGANAAGLPAGIAQGALPTAATAPVGALGSVAAPGGQLALAAPNLSGAASAAGAAAKSPGFLSKFAQETSLGQKGMLGNALPIAAGTSVLGALSNASTPKMPRYNPDEEESDFEYVPMGPGDREVRFQSPDEMRRTGGAEFQYFTPTNPKPVPLYGERPGYAEGGTASAPPQGFDELVQYFGSVSPGAITAPSGYPSTAPAPRGEVVHNFRQPGTTAQNLGIADGFGPYGTFPGLNGLGGFNFSAADYDTAVNRLRGDLGLGSMGGVQPSAPPIMSAQPSAPPTMLSPFEGMNYGGPYRTTLPTIPQVEEKEVGYSPGSGGRPVGAYESMMFQEYARGGAVDMRDGAFVVDARTVSELGNGSSNAGIEMLAKMGGRPVQGPGDGVSDSVEASIGGQQQARVARDEVIFQPDAVRRIGGGSEARGTQKLYAMMDKAHKARKKAERGQDTGLRRGLA